MFTSHCVLCRKDKSPLACTWVLCQQKVKTGGNGWGHPQGDLDMVAARLGFERAMAVTGWATSHPDCMGRLRKHYSYLVGGWFLPRNAAWALNRCMTTKSADSAQTLLLPFAVDLWHHCCVTNLSKHYTKFVTQHRQHLAIFLIVALEQFLSVDA